MQVVRCAGAEVWEVVRCAGFQVWVVVRCAGARRFPCLTHSLRGQHFVDGVVVLLGQDGQLTCLLLFEAFEDGLVVGLWSALQQVVPQSFVLTGLDLAGLLELTLDLQLFGLKQKEMCRVHVNCFYTNKSITSSSDQ